MRSKMCCASSTRRSTLCCKGRSRTHSFICRLLCAPSSAAALPTRMPCSGLRMRRMRSSGFGSRSPKRSMASTSSNCSCSASRAAHRGVPQARTLPHVLRGGAGHAARAAQAAAAALRCCLSIQWRLLVRALQSLFAARASHRCGELRTGANGPHGEPRQCASSTDLFSLLNLTPLLSFRLHSAEKRQQKVGQAGTGSSQKSAQQTNVSTISTTTGTAESALHAGCAGNRPRDETTSRAECSDAADRAPLCTPSACVEGTVTSDDTRLLPRAHQQRQAAAGECGSCRGSVLDANRY